MKKNDKKEILIMKLKEIMGKYYTLNDNLEDEVIKAIQNIGKEIQLNSKALYCLRKAEGFYLESLAVCHLGMTAHKKLSYGDILFETELMFSIIQPKVERIIKNTKYKFSNIIKLILNSDYLRSYIGIKDKLTKQQTSILIEDLYRAINEAVFDEDEDISRFVVAYMTKYINGH